MFDLTTPLLELDGSPMLAETKPITLGDAILGALIRPVEEDQKRSLSATLDIFKMQVAVSDAHRAKQPLELNSDEISTVLERASKVFWNGPVLVGRLTEILDPVRVKPKPTAEPDKPETVE